MEQKDYLLREIEKIGVILGVTIQKIIGGKGNAAIAIEQQVENAKEKLLDEINFNIDKFLDLNIEDSKEYIFNFEGFNANNIELLAKCFSETGFTDNCVNSNKYLEKALQLYNLCNLKSKTYSLEREENINTIKNALLFD